MESFEHLLQQAAAQHGHLCPGQVLGVRMAMLGCRAVRVEQPRSTKQLVVYVEVDRCATDAIAAVTGCTLGKRTLKHVDYGKMAATFLNTETGLAVRVVARDDSREKAQALAVDGERREACPSRSPESKRRGSRRDAQLWAYRVLADDELFTLARVHLRLREGDRPGPPVGRTTCHRCGEGVSDGREVVLDGRTLCRGCAYGAYYNTDDGDASQTGREGFSPSIALVQAAPLTGAPGGNLLNDEHVTRPVLCVVGPSNSGKTRVVEVLLRELSAQGYRVAAAKHCPHGYSLDREKSDSHRMRVAGARRVALASPGEWAVLESVDEDQVLDDLLSRVGAGMDLVLAEGFRSSRAPKVLVRPEAADPTWQAPANVVAVVTDNGPGGPPLDDHVMQPGQAYGRPLRQAQRKPWQYRFEDMNSLTEFVKARFITPDRVDSRK